MLELEQVDLDELVMALSDQDIGDHHWLIDPRTGSLHLWSHDVGLDGDDTIDGDDLEEMDLLGIDPVPTRQWYRDMADFAAGLSDPRARTELEIALDGRGAFRRFKNTLHQRHPDLVPTWREFQQARGRRAAITWLVDQGLLDPHTGDQYLENHPLPTPP